MVPKTEDLFMVCKALTLITENIGENSVWAYTVKQLVCSCNSPLYSHNQSQEFLLGVLAYRITVFLTISKANNSCKHYCYVSWNCHQWRNEIILFTNMNSRETLFWCSSYNRLNSSLPTKIISVVIGRLYSLKNLVELDRIKKHVSQEQRSHDRATKQRTPS